METPKGINFQKLDRDFISRYANNVAIETTLWDLKLIFGQTDDTIGANSVTQHTAITLSWTYLKVFNYLISSQLAQRELEYGRIQIPNNLVSPPPAELTPEMRAGLRHPDEWLALIKKMHEEFVAENPETRSVK
jgi:hypothetical protein